jgi:hypothetical protein
MSQFLLATFGLIVFVELCFAQITPEQVAKLSVTVAVGDEVKAFASAVPNSLRQLQQEANARSTAEWKQITNR